MLQLCCGVVGVRVAAVVVVVVILLNSSLHKLGLNSLNSLSLWINGDVCFRLIFVDVAGVICSFAVICRDELKLFRFESVPF